MNLIRAGADRKLIKEATNLSDERLNELENKILIGEISSYKI